VREMDFTLIIEKLDSM